MGCDRACRGIERRRIERSLQGCRTKTNGSISQNALSFTSYLYILHDTCDSSATRGWSMDVKHAKQTGSLTQHTFLESSNHDL